jgi:Ankyrin repeats (many copies)
MPPPRPINLDKYRIQAEDLLKQAHAAQPNALDRLRKYHPEGESWPATDGFQLADAQVVVARENDFPAWAKFAEHLIFLDAVNALDAGNYSWLEDLLDGHGLSLMDLLVANGEPKMAMEQAFTWACMLGRTSDVEFLLEKGVDTLAGDNTGLNGFHYAVWHGHLDISKLLIERKVPLEVRNMYGGTVLGCAIDGAENRPMPDHMAIIEALLAAGAKIDEAGYPTGTERIDEILRHHGAAS